MTGRTTRKAGPAAVPRPSAPRPAGRAAAAIVGSLPLWAAVCFLASGAAGLLYEIVWSKELSRLLGNTLHAVAAVVTAFLAGLAIGAATLGPWLGRRDGPRRYAWLEIGIAFSASAPCPRCARSTPCSHRSTTRSRRGRWRLRSRASASCSSCSFLRRSSWGRRCPCSSDISSAGRSARSSRGSTRSTRRVRWSGRCSPVSFSCRGSVSRPRRGPPCS